MAIQPKSRIVAAIVDDLFFTTKIETVARQTGTRVVFTQSGDQLLRSVEQEIPDLIIIDLNSRNSEPVASIRQIKADPRLAGVPLIGFFSHVQVELQRAARDAGCDHVLARSAFSARLPDLLRGVDS